MEITHYTFARYVYTFGVALTGILIERHLRTSFGEYEIFAVGALAAVFWVLYYEYSMKERFRLMEERFGEEGAERDE